MDKDSEYFTTLCSDLFVQKRLCCDGRKGRTGDGLGQVAQHTNTPQETKGQEGGDVTRNISCPQGGRVSEVCINGQFSLSLQQKVYLFCGLHASKSASLTVWVSLASVSYGNCKFLCGIYWLLHGN